MNPHEPRKIKLGKGGGCSTICDLNVQEWGKGDETYKDTGKRECTGELQPREIALKLA